MLKKKPLYIILRLPIIKEFKIFTHTTYPKALFQYGLLSILSASFCTWSTNIQQQGASQHSTMNPAKICHIPPKILLKLKDTHIQTPSIIATEKKKRKKHVKLVIFNIGRSLGARLYEVQLMHSHGLIASSLPFFLTIFVIAVFLSHFFELSVCFRTKNV